MTWPIGGVSINDLDSTDDSPASARSAIYSGIQKLNQMIEHGEPLKLEDFESYGQKVDRIYDVRDYGGSPDNSTDNYSSVLDLRNARGSGATIKFPYVGGTQNIYKFTSGTCLVFDGQSLDVDEGVTLSFPDDSFLYTTAKYKVVRPFKWFNHGMNFGSWVSNYRNRSLVDKSQFLSSADLDMHTLKPVICNTSQLLHKKVSWPSGDAFSSVSPSYSSVSGVQWVNPTTGVFNISFARVQPGDEISCYFDGVAGAPILTALVRGSGGYGGIYTGATDDGSGTQIFRKDVGASAVNVDVGYFGKGSHANYSGVRSIWTIRIVTWNSYVVLFNGMQISIGFISGPIEEAGFGVFTESTCTAVTQDWVIRRNNSVNGISVPLSITVFGDSITADRYECWPNYMRETLEGTLGLRVYALTNRAISGDNMSGQWGQMNSLGIAGAGIVIVQVGTNDIQGLTSKSAFEANLLNMYNYCVANNATIIFGLPPQFYTQGQAGSRGQASSNYEKGNYIRSAIQRFCADKGIRCVDTNQILGPMLAHYVNPSLSPYWGGDAMNDPMLIDNIHPGPVMERLLGFAYARAVAGAMATQGNNYVPGSLFLSPTQLSSDVLLNGWVFTTEPVRWYCDDLGNVGFSGVIDKGPSIADGTDIMVLPRNLWPAQNKRVVCATNQWTKPCMLQVRASDGVVSLYGAQAGTNYVYADGMVWNIKQA